MKHLKRFNESTEEALDIDYIRQCFIDLIDNEEVEIEMGTKGILFIFKKEPELEDGDIEGYVESRKNQIKFMDTIKSSIDKVLDEYPEYKYKYWISESGENNAWVNTIERDINIYWTK